MLRLEAVKTGDIDRFSRDLIEYRHHALIPFAIPRPAEAPVAAAVGGLMHGFFELDGKVVDVELAGEAALLEPFPMLLGKDMMPRRPCQTGAAAGGLAHTCHLGAFTECVHAVHGSAIGEQENVTAGGAEIGVEAELAEALANVA